MNIKVSEWKSIVLDMQYWGWKTEDVWEGEWGVLEGNVRSWLVRDRRRHKLKGKAQEKNPVEVYECGGIKSKAQKNIEMIKKEGEEEER